MSWHYDGSFKAEHRSIESAEFLVGQMMLLQYLYAKAEKLLTDDGKKEVLGLISHFENKVNELVKFEGDGHD